MLAATHAIAGSIIAKSAPTPIVGYLIALLSHPFLDFFPHWDLHTRHNGKSKFTIIWTSLTDAGVGLLIGYLLFKDFVDPTVLLVTMFVSQLPDWIESPFHVFDWKVPPFSSIKKLQSAWHNKMPLPWGIVPQIAILLLAMAIA